MEEEQGKTSLLNYAKELRVLSIYAPDIISRQIFLLMAIDYEFRAESLEKRSLLKSK